MRTPDCTVFDANGLPGTLDAVDSVFPAAFWLATQVAYRAAAATSPAAPIAMAIGLCPVGSI
jgi:hypothetical protein